MSATESRPGGVGRPASAARTPAGLEGAQTITLSRDEAVTVETIAARLPDPTTLPAGTLVVVPGSLASRPSLASAVLSVFGRGPTVPRALRCSALVARGYVEVGAARGEARTDLAWGYAPAATEPCSDS